MEKRKRLVIGILVCIIICLLIFIGLLVGGVINLGNNTNESTEDINDSGKVTENSDFVITYKEEKEEFKNSNDKVVIINKRNLPIINSNSNKETADKIVNYLMTISDNDWKKLNETSKSDATAFPDDYNVGVTYTFSTVMNTMSIVSISYDMDGGMGGVSWLGNWGYNFNKTNGDVLEFSDVIVDSSTSNNLYDYIINDIETNYENLWNDEVSGDWKNIVKDNMFKLGNWLFTDKGITVTFDKYLLGPGAIGVVKVDIPYSELNKYLKDEYKG